MDESPKRFDRIVAILIQLQSKRIVKAQEIADRFEVSLRTIYRDIRTLEAAGIPIYSEAGIGYSLMEGYRLPPVMFTREEASSFIAAEKLMQKFTDKELGLHYHAATLKLKAVMKSADQDFVSAIDANVLMRPNSPLFHDKAPDTLAVLFKCIAEKLQVRISYQALNATFAADRLIEPVGVFHDHASWYVLGFCHLRKDYRQFRTDRIHGISITENPFTLKHQPLDSFLQKEVEHCETTRVIIRVDKKIAHYLDYEKTYHGFVSSENKGNLVEMTFLSRDISNGFARWFMMFGDCAEIIEPDILKESVLHLLEEMQNKLRLVK